MQTVNLSLNNYLFQKEKRRKKEKRKNGTGRTRKTTVFKKEIMSVINKNFEEKHIK